MSARSAVEPNSAARADRSSRCDARWAPCAESSNGRASSPPDTASWGRGTVGWAAGGSATASRRWGSREFAGDGRRGRASDGTRFEGRRGGNGNGSRWTLPWQRRLRLSSLSAVRWTRAVCQPQCAGAPRTGSTLCGRRDGIQRQCASPARYPWNRAGRCRVGVFCGRARARACRRFGLELPQWRTISGLRAPGAHWRIAGSRTSRRTELSRGAEQAVGPSSRGPGPVRAAGFARLGRRPAEPGPPAPARPGVRAGRRSRRSLPGPAPRRRGRSEGRAAAQSG
jgi:hypothetical protein